MSNSGLGSFIIQVLLAVQMLPEGSRGFDKEVQLTSGRCAIVIADVDGV